MPFVRTMFATGRKPTPRSCRHAVALALAWILGWAAALPAAAEELALAVSRSPLSLPLFVAQQQGFFASEGLEVKVTECIGGHRCIRSVLEGRTQVATASELPVVFNSFDRSDFAVIGTFATTGDDVKVIVNGRTGIATAAQLAGKRVGVVIGTSSQYFLDLYLLTAGVDPRHLRLVGLQPEEMVEALRNGLVDAIAIWEPYAWLATKALPADARMLPRGSGYVSTFNLIAQRALIGRHDAALAKLLKAVERAEQFIQERPEQAKEILRQRLQLDRAFIDWVWPGLSFRLGLDQSLLTTMESEARWAQREGHIQGKSSPNYLALIHTAPLQAIKPTAVGTAR